MVSLPLHKRVFFLIGLASFVALSILDGRDPGNDVSSFEEIFTIRSLRAINSELLHIPEVHHKETETLIKNAWDMKLSENYFRDSNLMLQSKHRASSKLVTEEATICICPKCGTSSFYMKLYEITHNKSKEYKYKDSKWVWNLDDTSAWKNLKAERKTDWSNFSSSRNSLAVIRDPKERILSSWKSKVMCHEDADSFDAINIVPQLLRLVGLPDSTASHYTDKNGEITPCLDLSLFLVIMLQVHLEGKDGIVNHHFRPQHLYCFLHAPPSEWGVVTTIDDGSIACELKAMLGISNNDQNECKMGQEHSTDNLSRYTNITDTDHAILNAITREEYRVLAPYLK